MSRSTEHLNIEDEKNCNQESISQTNVSSPVALRVTPDSTVSELSNEEVSSTLSSPLPECPKKLTCDDDDIRRKVSKNLEEIDKKLEILHELAEDVYLTTSLAADQSKFFDKFFENGRANLKKCETVPEDLSKQVSEEDGILEEVEEAVRDAEEKQFEVNHVPLNIDTECSSEDETNSSNQRFNEFCRSNQETLFNTPDSGLSLRTTSNRRVRHRISSNATLNDFQNGHERARSNDSRSTSLFSSSIASFRRPISHFSIDNSCFDLNDAQTQHSLMCTPVEKMYTKNSRSAPEMLVHDAKICSFVSSPSPSNDATTTASEPSVSSEISIDQPISPVVANLRLRPDEGLTERALPVTSPVLKPKNKKEKMSLSRLKMSSSSSNMNNTSLAVNLMSSPTLENHAHVKRRTSENRTVEVITIQISNLTLVRKLKKSLYIMAKLDAKDVHRSPKIKWTSNIVLHEFTVETTDPFSKFHIIFLEGSKAKVARPVGKVTLSRKTIENGKQIDYNLKLCALSKYPEFCGQICIDVRRRSGAFSIRVVDCGLLNIKDNQSLLLLVSTVGSSSEVGKLSIDGDEKRSKEWLEMPCVEGMLSLKLTLWQDLLKGVNSVFHGQVRVDVDENWEAGPAKWVYLRSKSREERDTLNENEEIGEVVIKSSHQTDHILRLQTYKPLLDLIVASSEVQPITASLVAVIESLPKVELSQMSRSLVELIAQSNQIRPVLNSLYVNSILKCQDENTLFRGQSLAGKMLFEILTSFGKMYLITTLKPVIDKIYKERKNCEIDPSRIISGSNIEKNKANVLVYFQILFQRVCESSTNCPHFIKVLLSDLRSVVGKHTGRIDVQRLAISSFVIMRFFAAAVLNPKAFEIRKDQPDLRVSRTLLLLSKMLQRVSNCTVSQGPLSSKEVWLCEVFEMVTGEQHKQDMTDFLDKISLVGEFSEPEKSTVFKFGNLQHVDRIRLAWKRVLQYKKRYVQLTESHLIWQKDVNTSGSPKGTLKLTDIKSINVDNKNIITIITDLTQIQFEAPGFFEANDWVLAIEKQRTRSGAESEENVVEPLTFDVERHIDKIHNALYKYKSTMTEWIGLLESKEQLDDKAPELLIANFVPEDQRDLHKQTLISTLRATIDVTDSIQKERDEYEKDHQLQQQMEESAVDENDI